MTTLFPNIAGTLIPGYVYEAEFLSREDEAELVRVIEGLPLAAAEYKQFRARRRIVSYGGRYDFSANRLGPAEPIPDFLLPLREKVARWAGESPEQFAHALIAEYPPGTQLGWHRDVPNFEKVVGVSLLSACRMRFRRYPPRPRERSVAIELEPRSVYRMEGEARWSWQHHIPPTPALRYSITFRTLRAGKAPAISIAR
ncbi:MAG: alpha-ketoglutarate-dependent dioxygenase AlkB [Steroidobacteraceae bacterium]|nr:alpha-ketoglutarate-dependent dioxygenase AlkB [Steroidobacteraceae bacterium]